MSAKAAVMGTEAIGLNSRSTQWAAICLSLTEEMAWHLHSIWYNDSMQRPVNLEENGNIFSTFHIKLFFEGKNIYIFLKNLQFLFWKNGYVVYVC